MSRHSWPQFPPQKHSKPNWSSRSIKSCRSEFAHRFTLWYSNSRYLTMGNVWTAPKITRMSFPSVSMDRMSMDCKLYFSVKPSTVITCTRSAGLRVFDPMPNASNPGLCWGKLVNPGEDEAAAWIIGWPPQLRPMQAPCTSGWQLGKWMS